MAFPPPILPINRVNADPRRDLHPADHNAMAAAENDLAAFVTGQVGVIKAYSNNGSVPNVTWTRCTVGTVQWNNNQGFGMGGVDHVNTSRPGFILFMPEVCWGTSNGTGRRLIGLSSSSSIAPGVDFHDDRRAVPADQVHRCIIPWVAAVNSQFHLWVYQDSGATMTLTVRRVNVLRLT
jgi:hypothetical protein